MEIIDLDFAINKLLTIYLAYLYKFFQKIGKISDFFFQYSKKFTYKLCNTLYESQKTTKFKARKTLPYGGAQRYISCERQIAAQFAVR